MKHYRNITIILAILCCLLAGCDTQKEANAATIKEQAAEKETHFYRLESVTYQRQDRDAEVYPINWEEDFCTFSHMDSKFKSHLDPETKVFSVLNAENETEQVLLHKYDESGKITHIYPRTPENTGLPVTYDEGGWPICNWDTEKYDFYNYEIDKENRTVKMATAGMEGVDESGTRKSEKLYQIRTVGPNGTVISVDELTVSFVNGEQVSEKTEENAHVYTYDEYGNLLSFETDNLTVTFTYSDEPVHHNSERTIPLLYLNGAGPWDLPLFWNVK